MADYLYNIGAYPKNSQQTSQQGITNHLLRNVEAYRRANPIRIPFATGTPTLARRELDQRQAQFEKEYELALRRQAEEERQNRIANQLAQARLAQEGSSGGSSVPGTLSERQTRATATLYNAAVNRYNNLLEAGYNYPLYYTVNTLIADKNWTKAAMESGADVKSAVDNLLRTQGFSPEQYFQTKQGSKLKAKYESLYKKADFEGGGGAGVDLGDPELNKIIENASAQAGVPKNILGALVKAESGGNPNARSKAGAIGLAQLLPSTAKGLGVDPYDPVQNVMGGAKYLKQQYDKYGDWELALAAYNAGPGNVDKYGGIPPFKETQNYVQRVLKTAGVMG